jgi:RES domain-containing protein
VSARRGRWKKLLKRAGVTRFNSSALAAIGDAWVRSRRSLALEAPSVVAPGDYNVLINPAHPSFDEIVFDDQEKLRLDERILNG